MSEDDPTLYTPVTSEGTDHRHERGRRSSAASRNHGSRRGCGHCSASPRRSTTVYAAQVFAQRDIFRRICRGFDLCRARNTGCAALVHVEAETIE